MSLPTDQALPAEVEVVQEATVEPGILGDMRPSPELTPEETFEKARVLEQTEHALGDLYDLLPHEGKLEQQHIVSSLEQTDLRILLSAVRMQLGAAIRREHLNERPRDEFVSAAVKPLNLWIHMEGLNHAADLQLARFDAGDVVAPSLYGSRPPSRRSLGAVAARRI